jgi:ABC-type transport system involved in cytochrome c biogenesis ATPase subunit
VPFGQWSGDSVRLVSIWRDKTCTCRYLGRLIAWKSKVGWNSNLLFFSTIQSGEDQPLRNAVMQLRRALGDLADEPVLVETIERSGGTQVPYVSSHAGEPWGQSR